MPRSTLTDEQRAARNAAKEDSFRKLASKRVNKVLNDIRLVANLAAPNYKSSMDQRTRIVTAIRRALDELEAVFAGDKRDDSKFEL